MGAWISAWAEGWPHPAVYGEQFPEPDSPGRKDFLLRLGPPLHLAQNCSIITGLKGKTAPRAPDLKQGGRSGTATAWLGEYFQQPTPHRASISCSLRDVPDPCPRPRSQFLSGRAVGRWSETPQRWPSWLGRRQGLRGLSLSGPQLSAEGFVPASVGLGELLCPLTSCPPWGWGPDDHPAPRLPPLSPHPHLRGGHMLPSGPIAALQSPGPGMVGAEIQENRIFPWTFQKS